MSFPTEKGVPQLLYCLEAHMMSCKRLHLIKDKDRAGRRSLMTDLIAPVLQCVALQYGRTDSVDFSRAFNILHLRW